MHSTQFSPGTVARRTEPIWGQVALGFPTEEWIFSDNEPVVGSDFWVGASCKS